MGNIVECAVMELLSGIRFTVRSYGPAAAYAGWLLHEFGAEVEHTTALDPEGLGAFLGQGATTQGEPPIATAHGVTLITDAPVTDANRVALGRLAEIARVVWITPWGLDPPWAELPATDLVLQAAGGWMSAVGDPGREPLGPPGAQGRLTAGLYSAIAALAGPEVPAGIIDVAVVEAVAATTIYEAVGYQLHGIARARAGNRFSRPNCTLVTLPCLDGHVGLHIALHRQWLSTCALIGHPELSTDPRFADPLSRAANIESLDNDYLLPWLSQRTRWQAYHELEGARVAASALPDIAEVLASPQLGAREAWEEVTTPGGRTYSVPGPPARITAVTASVATPRKPGPWKEGALRVVDLSMGWAGPLVSHILASFGADVIKVEGPNHFDWWRGSRPPGDDPSLALPERSPVFNTVNRGKRGVAFDLTTEQGNRLARDLIATADVIIENFAPGVLERLGLGYELIAGENPALIMLRQPSFGSTGPEAAYVGFGNTIEGMSGLSSLIGYAGGPPMMMSNAFGDPISGLNGVIAVLAALEARKRDGTGRLIEASQLEGFLPMVSEALMEYQRTGVLRPRDGNRRAGSAPCGLFPCAGEDRWIAIEVNTQAAWKALTGVIGEAWAVSPELATSDQRKAAEETLDLQLAKWTAGQDRDDLAHRLAAAGCPSAAMNGETDILASDLLLTREFYTPLERAHVGTLLYPSLPIRTGQTRSGVSIPAPTLGQHTAEVLTAMGVRPEVQAKLRESQVIA